MSFDDTNEWERLHYGDYDCGGGEWLERTEIPGGWLYRTIVQYSTAFSDDRPPTGSVAMVFVPRRP